MEYSINKLAQLAGVSTRTLRYYDEIGLISPKRVSSTAIVYTVKRKWTCCSRFYFTVNWRFRWRNQMHHMVKGLYSLEALQEHLTALKTKRQQIELLIKNVKNQLPLRKER